MKNILTLSCMALFLLTACSKSSVVNPQKQSSGGGSDSTVTPSPSYRPLFHYTTDKDWINDPNGLVFYNGSYHLFSQYNPFGYVWGNMSWEQAASPDFFSWQESGIALNEFTNPSGGTSLIFSGSAVIDSTNSSGFGAQSGQIPMVAIYTSNNSAANGNAVSQTQCISYSLDQGQTWTAYSQNPVLDIGSTQFRDPKVFWYAPTKNWVMVVSKPDVDSVRIYTSSNLKNWTFKSDFGAIGNTNQVWECPDLYQLSVEGTSQKKWVLSVSGGGVENGFGGMQYFIGNFDGSTFTADADNYPLYVDYGKDYYAGVTYNGISDGRTVMVSWANNWSYANAIPTTGYRGQYAIPRSLSLRKVNNSDGYHLLQTPVAEISNHESAVYSNTSLSVSSAMNLDSVSGMALDIQFNLSVANAATAGINVLQSGSEQTAITFNKGLSEVSLDRTKSGITSFSSQFSGVESAKMDNVDFTNLTCRILIDQSVVEVFVNNGEYAITDLVFPTHSKGGLTLFSTGGTAKFTNLVIKKVNKTIH